MDEFLSKNLEDTADFARNFLSKFEVKKDSANVVGLYGELGSGKTTFMKYLAEALGIKDTIQSPTFVIMKRYKIAFLTEFGSDTNKESAPLSLARRGGLGGEVGFLIHIDAYRLDSGEDLLKLGWQEIISDPKNLICVEWPERVAEIMPPHIKIFFEHVSENERKIKIENL